jgi:hypothetical protein
MNNNGRNFRSAKPDLGCIENVPKPWDLRGRKDDPMDKQTLMDASLHNSFTVRDLVVGTSKEYTTFSGIDESQHSVLTEESTSKRRTIFENMGNRSALTLDLRAMEENDEDIDPLDHISTIEGRSGVLDTSAHSTGLVFEKRSIYEKLGSSIISFGDAVEQGSWSA